METDPSPWSTAWNYWIVGLLDYWIAGLLIIELLDYWIIGLLDYWIVGLLDSTILGLLQYPSIRVSIIICSMQAAAALLVSKEQDSVLDTLVKNAIAHFTHRRWESLGAKINAVECGECEALLNNASYQQAIHCLHVNNYNR